MIKFLKRIWFGNPNADKVKRIPAVGEKWVFNNEDKSPWETTKKYNPVTILDVKAGWVRYSMGGYFNDCRHKIEMFTYLYSPLD